MDIILDGSWYLIKKVRFFFIKNEKKKKYIYKKRAFGGLLASIIALVIYDLDSSDNNVWRY